MITVTCFIQISNFSKMNNKHFCQIVFLYTYIYTHTHIYIYTHIYIHIYIHTYIYTYFNQNKYKHVCTFF